MNGPPPECVIRVENGDFVLRDRDTGTEYARGAEPTVRAAAAAYRVTDAPHLGPVLAAVEGHVLRGPTVTVPAARADG